MRNQSLDVLRAVAVLLVFSRHTEGLSLVSRLGWVGVDLFFVLSGFLVSGLLFREYQQSSGVLAGRFLIRRAFKIYPQFYLFVTVTLLAMYLSGGSVSPRRLLAELTFFQNYTRGVWGPTWSLAVEEHFYLLLTLAFVILARRDGPDPFRCLPKWILSACAIILGLRVATWYWHPQTSDYVHIFPSHLRMDSLLWGVLLSYYSAFRLNVVKKFAKRFGPWLPQASILMLSPISFLNQSHPFVYTVGFSLNAMAFVLLLISVLHPQKPAEPGRVFRALAAVGQVSYAFYLWHGPVLVVEYRIVQKLAERGFTMPIAFDIVVTLGLALAVAFLTTRLVEQPVLRLRDRWFPSRPRIAERSLAA